VRPPPPVYKTYFALGASILAPGPGDASAGEGLTGLYERRIGKAIGIAARLEYLVHPDTTAFFRNETISASELIALFGLRTMTSNTLHGRVGLGFTIYSQDITDDNTLVTLDSFTRLYPAFELGGGAHLGRLRLQASILFTTAAGGEVDLGTRFMGTIGIDLYRK